MPRAIAPETQQQLRRCGGLRPARPLLQRLVPLRGQGGKKLAPQEYEDSKGKKWTCVLFEDPEGGAIWQRWGCGQQETWLKQGG